MSLGSVGSDGVEGAGTESGSTGSVVAMVFNVKLDCEEVVHL